MNFTKYHIVGKDYIFCADKNDFENLTTKDITALCDRHKGAGATGIFTFYQNSDKTSFIKGFSENGELMQNFSSASICALFELFLSTGTVKHSFSAANGEFFTVKIDLSDKSHIFSSTLTADSRDGIFGTVRRKTEIGNRILTVTPVWLHSIYAVHFTDCREKLNIEYLGRHISENSLFRKKGSLILAEAKRKNMLDISFYENNTGCPRPELSAFGAVALAACRNGMCIYGDEIAVTSYGNAASVICHSSDAVTIKCTCERVFDGHL